MSQSVASVAQKPPGFIDHEAYRNVFPVVIFRNEGPHAGARYALGDPLRRVALVIAVGLTPAALLTFAAQVSRRLLPDVMGRSWPPGEEPLAVGDLLLLAGNLYVCEEAVFVPLAEHLTNAPGR